MSDEKKGFLDGAYSLDSVEDTGEHYARWAATYETELRDNGYATPERCAGALAAHVNDKNEPVLDLGCGTGLSGVALHEAGFSAIDGLDYSPEMLACAREKTGIYRQLGRVDLSQPLDIPRGRYAHACATGVVSPGHAPIEAVRYVLDILPVGGRFVLSLNDHALADGYEAGIREVCDDGSAELLFREDGEHLPGIDLRSVVFVLSKRTP